MHCPCVQERTWLSPMPRGSVEKVKLSIKRRECEGGTQRVCSGAVCRKDAIHEYLLREKRTQEEERQWVTRRHDLHRLQYRTAHPWKPLYSESAPGKFRLPCTWCPSLTSSTGSPFPLLPFLPSRNSFYPAGTPPPSVTLSEVTDPRLSLLPLPSSKN